MDLLPFITTAGDMCSAQCRLHHINLMFFDSGLADSSI